MTDKSFEMIFVLGMRVVPSKFNQKLLYYRLCNNRPSSVVQQDQVRIWKIIRRGDPFLNMIWELRGK